MLICILNIKLINNLKIKTKSRILRKRSARKNILFCKGL